MFERNWTRHLVDHCSDQSRRQSDPCQDVISFQVFHRRGAAGRKAEEDQCPLAVVTALLTVATADLSDHPELAAELVSQAFDAFVAFGRGFRYKLARALSLSAWPVFRLLSVLDFLIAPQVRAEAIVIVGRLDRLEILQSYLHKALRPQGGPLDRVNFVVHNAIRAEHDFINELVQKYPGVYAAPSVFGKRLAKFYSFVDRRPRNTVFLKIDDDIVFLSKSAVRDLVVTKFFGAESCSMVSANVVNHAILSAVHNELGAVHEEYGPVIYPDHVEQPDHVQTQTKDGTSITGGSNAGEDVAEQESGSLASSEQDSSGGTNGPWLPQIEKHAQSPCVWKSWECAEWVHRSFLHHYYARTLEALSGGSGLITDTQTQSRTPAAS